jgi:tRNA(Arg) A34 adenosine deaminase TadA
MCLSAIYWARIQNVYYGNTRFDAANIGFSDADIYNEFVLPTHKKVVNITQCATENMQNAFIEWSNLENKTTY